MIPDFQAELKVGCTESMIFTIDPSNSISEITIASIGGTKENIYRVPQPQIDRNYCHVEKTELIDLDLNYSPNSTILSKSET